MLNATIQKDQTERKPYDSLVAPLFEFCCNRIRSNAGDSNFPQNIVVNDVVEDIMQWSKTDAETGDPLHLLLCFYPEELCKSMTETGLANTLRYQLIGRVNGVKNEHSSTKQIDKNDLARTSSRRPLQKINRLGLQPMVVNYS